MRQKTIEKLCCPFDRADLGLKITLKDLDNSVIEGMLNCPICKRMYPIIHGVPIMLPDEYRQTELEQPMLRSGENILTIE